MKELPQNISAEKAVLGSIMLKNDVLAEIMGIIQPEDFYREAHKLAYKTMLAMSAVGEPIDIVTLTEKLRKDGTLEKVGGIMFVSDIANAVPSAASAEYYANIVLEKARLRRLIDAGNAITASAYEAGDVDEAMDRAEQTLLTATKKASGRRERTMKEILFETYDHINELVAGKGGVTGLSTGLVELDNITSGLHKSDFIIVAARPSMGKTALGLNIAAHAALHDGKSVALFSLEMSPIQLVERIMCSEVCLDSRKLQKGMIADEDWPRLIDLSQQLDNSHLHIDDTPNITVAELRQKARRYLVEDGHLDLIVIDYVQLMRGSSGKGENRQQEISEISRSLKVLARELDVPIIALSQLSRAVESRMDKHPLMSDLRESGSLEQDADIVMLLYRDDYYEQEAECPGLTEVNIAKHRNGPTGMVRLFFHKQFTKFSDVAMSEEGGSL